MPIIYSLIARDQLILAEYTSTSGNFQAVTRRILEKIPPKDCKMSYVYDRFDYIFCKLLLISLLHWSGPDRHIFHIMLVDGLTYLCMADEEFGRRVPFTFLEDIKNRFSATYGDKGKTALAYAMNEDFSVVLMKQMVAPICLLFLVCLRNTIRAIRVRTKSTG